MIERGNLVVVEGASGVGKTTLIKNLYNEVLGQKWLYKEEPGGTIFGVALRGAVQGVKSEGYNIHPLAALFVYNASRAQLVHRVLVPSLNEGKNILLDRYWYSSYAYQGAEGVPRVIIKILSKIATGGLDPDLVLYLDLETSFARERLKKKSTTYELDRYDKMGEEFHRQVRKNYLELGRKYPERWKTLNASLSVGELTKSASRLLKDYNIID